MDKRILYGHGVDVKRFQYEEYAENLCFNKIDLKHLIEIYKTQPDFFKYEIDKLGNKRILYPKPDYTYP